MHYYQFNIGDYKSHTEHLDLIEDIAYRRMLDWCYLHEKPLPESVDDIARLINMRPHCDAIKTILSEFFNQTRKRQWFNKRADICIAAYRKKSENARASANARWNKDLPDANALRTDCERNAKHKPLNNNHKPVSSASAELPEWVNIGAWNEFEQHRKEIRQPLTDLARTKAQNILKDLSFDQQAEVIDNSIQNRWRGLFPEKLNGTHKGSGAESNHSRVMRGLADRIRSE